jgi:Uma2 family endonuclease
MGYPQVEKQYLTAEEYFALEETSEIRHEFYEGEIFAMAGTTLDHNRIVGSVNDLLKAVFRPRGCETFTESVKLEAIKNTYYPYPDVMVTCHKLDLQSKYTIANPLMLVEVLSKSTTDNDRDFKLKKYKKIPSLQHYLLVFAI